MNKLKFLFGILAALVAVYFFTIFLIYSARIRDICNSSLSMNYSEVELKLRKLISSGRNGEFVVHSTKNFGRGVCLLKVDAQGVVESARFALD